MKRSEPDQTRVLLTRKERLLLLRRLELSPALRSQLEPDSSRSMEVWLSVDEADERGNRCRIYCRRRASMRITSRRSQAECWRA